MDRLREAAQEQIEQLIQQQLQAELETYDITGQSHTEAKCAALSKMMQSSYLVTQHLPKHQLSCQNQLLLQGMR